MARTRLRFRRSTESAERDREIQIGNASEEDETYNGNQGDFDGRPSWARKRGDGERRGGAEASPQFTILPTAGLAQNIVPERVYDPLLFGARLEIPMYTKIPRAWPTPVASASPSTPPEFAWALPSPLMQWIEYDGSDTSTPRYIQQNIDFDQEKRHAVTDTGIDRIINYGDVHAADEHNNDEDIFHMGTPDTATADTLPNSPSSKDCSPSRMSSAFSLDLMSPTTREMAGKSTERLRTSSGGVQSPTTMARTSVRVHGSTALAKLDRGNKKENASEEDEEYNGNQGDFHRRRSWARKQYPPARFYKSILPSAAVSQNIVRERVNDPFFDERLEAPMDIKIPRAGPTSVASVSPSKSAEFASAVPSPVMQWIEYDGSDTSTPRHIQQNIDFDQKKRHAVTDTGIDRIINYGSEEESGSEDETLVNDEVKDEMETSASFPAAIHSTALSSEGVGSPVIFEEAVLHNTSVGPEHFFFDWKTFPETPTPQWMRREVFTRVGGPTLSLGGPEETFTAIWDRVIMDQIVTETNRYAEEELKKIRQNIGPQSRLQRWTPTDVDELYIYFGVLLAMGNCVKTNVKEYWLCNGSICDTPNFSKYMTYNRYVLLNKFLHFASNGPEVLTLSPAEAKIFKIKPLVDHLNQKFQSLYELKKDICINETLIRWKRWLSKRRFIRNKPAATGIRTYKLCDAKSGYLWRFELYSGNSGRKDQSLSGITLILHLLQGLENRGHCVWTDSAYNSPALARTLKAMGFDCVGTLRTNRQFLPPQLASLKSKMVGEVQGCTSGDIDILVWRDYDSVSMISTYHGNAVQSIKDKIKPIVVLDYDRCMGRVERKYQKLAMFPVEWKRTRIWYKQLFKRLLNVSVLNSYILLSESQVPDHPVPRFATHRGYRMELISSLLKRKASASAGAPKCSDITFFTEKYYMHLPKEYSALPDRGGETSRRACIVCHKRSYTYCPGCEVTVCAFTCFSRHHGDVN